MSEAFNIITENEFLEDPVIKVVGVGGGGGNMLNHMIEKGVKDIELICANTDAQALRTNKAPIKIQLGKELTKGLGAGMDPEVGKGAAQESEEEIKEVLEGANLVFISAGMGGGTGTGAAPVIARIAKELGALTIGVITKPFKREGAKRAKLAEIGFNELKKECDSIVTILNQKLLSIIDRRAGIREAYKMVDDILYQAVTGISNTIIMHGENDVNVDFADLKRVMSHRGMALMGIGHKSGENSATDALSQAIESPLLDDMNIADANGLLIHFTISDNYPLVEIDEAMESILGDLMESENVDIIEGQTTNNELADDEIIVTIIATGFDEKKAINNPTAAPKTTSADSIPNLTKKMAVGSEMYDLELSGEDIDIPTYLRKSRD
ncbi:MAG: cell division protein FtsZ [Epsilonproteobacteria bacterium]|nr:cell division protein FtsZ [Campylobacterota bacterium]